MRRVRAARARLTAQSARRRRLACALVAAFTVVFCGAATFSAQVRRPRPGPAAPRSTRHPQVKAVFEPVFSAEDVEFTDVFFVDAATGWAGGRRRAPGAEGGFIIGTRDRGRTWSVQLGDAATRAIAQLFFVDATHGWALQVDGRVLRTTDGRTWTPASDGESPGSLVFVSPDRGFLLDGRRDIQMTRDGGRTWAPAVACRVTVQTTGVVREQDCQPRAIAFAPDRSTGYMIADVPGGDTAAVFRTADRGETWVVASFVPGTSETRGSLAFSDAFTGYLLAAGSLRMTADGGRTWRIVDVAVPAEDTGIRLAGAAGWMVGSTTFSYTLDGGTRWSSRKVDFPARVARFSLPAPDVGFVAGSQGVLYRYGIVPFEYAVPHMITVPSMTTPTPDSF